MGRGAAGPGSARAPGVDVRGARLVLAPGARLARARRAARPVRQGSGLHPRRADARDAASVRGLLGLPGDRLLRAAVDARHAGRLPGVRRRAARARHRRDPRLGAGPLPARRLGAGGVRRHASLRARRPAPRAAPRLGHARLQPRAHRGAELPARERALLAPRVPRRRPARRCRRLDALPRLLAQGGGVGPERVRRPRGSRLGVVPEGAERARARARARRDLGRRGVDGVAGRLAPDLPRRARLRAEVEPGLDARHAGVLLARAGAPPLPPQRAHVLARLRVDGELHPAAVARRGRARQGLAAAEAARRPLAAARQPALALRVHVGPSRQEAPVHGRRARRPGRVEARRRAAVAAARARRARGRARPGARPEPVLPRRAGAVGGRLLAGGLRLDRAERRLPQRARVRAHREGRREPPRLRREPLAGPARELPPRPAARGALARGAEHRLRALRRLGRRQPRRRRGRGQAVARPRRLGARHRAAARRRLARSPRGRLDAFRLARAAVPARPRLGRRRHELLDLLRARRGGRALPLRRRRARGARPRPRAHGVQLALLPPGVGPGQRYGYRVHGPYDPLRGRALQPGQAADRPVREGDRRRRRLGRREHAAVRLLGGADADLVLDDDGLRAGRAEVAS